jgi:hypothetical protein
MSDQDVVSPISDATVALNDIVVVQYGLEEDEQ